MRQFIKIGFADADMIGDRLAIQGEFGMFGSVKRFVECPEVDRQDQASDDEQKGKQFIKRVIRIFLLHR